VRSLQALLLFAALAVRMASWTLGAENPRVSLTDTIRSNVSFRSIPREKLVATEAYLELN
jgi:hypothetical protein